MRAIEVMGVLSILLSAPFALAYPEDGTLKELGETVVSDAIQPAVAPAPAPQAPAEVVSAYGRLDPFQETAILQRRFLPKRNRFELSGEYGRLVDNAFFETQTFYWRAGYSILEVLAIEVAGYSADTKQSAASKSLYDNGGVVSSTFAGPKGYIGGNMKWSPIYGKLAVWDKKIIPVEQFFILGYGNTKIAGESDASTVNYGLGFSFGVMKWLAVRTGLDIFSYSTKSGNRFNDTHLHVGFSLFFPKAEYR